MSSEMAHAMQVTRERLADVANVWKGLAQAKLTPYLDKLPEAVRKVVKPMIAGTPAAVPGGAADAPS
jgi:hypothetical protein